MQPPNIIQFNASNVPVVQVTLSSKTMPEQQIFDYGLNFIRLRLFTIPACRSRRRSAASSGRSSSTSIPRALGAKGLVADGRGQRAADLERDRAGRRRAHRRRANTTSSSIPARSWSSSSPTCRSACAKACRSLLGDVAKVSDSFATQTNIVRINGQRASYMAILKHADASTLAVVDAVREHAAGASRRPRPKAWN